MRRALTFTLILFASVIIPISAIPASDTGKEINALDIKEVNGDLRIEIRRTGDLEFDLFKAEKPRRLVLDCIGANYKLQRSVYQAESPLIHRVRTSQYKVDPVPISRIVVDLKKAVNHRLIKEEGRHVLLISANNGANAPAASKSGAETTDKNSEKKNVSSLAGLQVAKAAMGPVLPLESPGVDSRPEQKGKEPERVKTASEPEERSPWIEEDEGEDSNSGASAGSGSANSSKPADTRAMPAFDSASIEAGNLPWSESYARGAPASGGGIPVSSKRLTIDAQGADIKTVLRTISDFAGVNIVAGSDVEGEVYIHVKDSPWQEALDVILKAHGYGYREEFGMIRVAENKRLLQEELNERTAERKKEDLLPLFTRVVFVHNSNAEEIKDALQNVVSKRGKVDVDMGSNALIINDIEQNIEKISEIVKNLDKKHLQVDINAKLVEVDVEAKQELGIKWDMLNLHKSDWNAVGSASVDESLPMSSGTFKFGTVNSWGELNAILQIMEKDNKANIISNPRITTVDNREATILVGKEIPLIVADEAGNPITELTKIGIMLRVIPHVNTDRTITLDLHPEVSELQAESTAQGGVIISTAEADTRVDVANGETAVIGGLIKKTDTEIRQGLPFLKDLPVIGGLFSSTTKANKKQELVIFVTPTIVE